MDLSQKAIFFFDLDNTVSPSREPMSPEMAALVAVLLDRAHVALVSGASLPQMREQFLDRLPDGVPGAGPSRLYLLPQGGNEILVYRDGEAESVYRNELSPERKVQIRTAFERVLAAGALELPAALTLDDVLQDKGGQVTFSALGANAPHAEKSAWDPNYEKRKALRAHLAPELPGFALRIGGTTSIDVTLEGFDKPRGVLELLRRLALPKEKAVYFGDALCHECNDYPMLATGIDVVGVSGPDETRRILETYLRPVP